MPPQERAAGAYAVQGHDSMREAFETGFFAGLLPHLLRQAGGSGAVLDLGCADGLAARLAGRGLGRYTGVDLREPAGGVPGEMVKHDLCDGLGPVGGEPFDLYLATFGVASHLSSTELRRLLGEIARHARPGSVVALEALGLHSLEWPRLWETEPGPARVLPYTLGGDVPVHPWAPAELAALYEQAGIRPLRALDRTVQAGPKVGEARYWPGLPPLRRAMNSMLDGTGGAAALGRTLPPLPAGRAAAVHHALAERRRRLIEAAAQKAEHGHAVASSAHVGSVASSARGGSVASSARRGSVASSARGCSAALARAVWALEPRSGGGFGHGLMVLGRVA